MAVAPTPSLLVAGIGEVVVSRDPATMLVAYGLGSCVGLGGWDPLKRVAGLAHFMLPSGPPDGAGTPAKFIDAGLDVFLDALEAHGASRRSLRLKAAGGAATLQVLAGGLAIGGRNSVALVSALTRVGLRLAASDFGGTSGRTVQLHVGNGRFLVKSLSTVHEL